MITGHFAPAQDRQAFFGGECFEAGDCGGVAVAGSCGQEGGADGVAAGRGQVEAGDGAEEFVGDLGEDAGAVAGAFVGAHGAAVFEVAQGRRGPVSTMSWLGAPRSVAMTARPHASFSFAGS